MSRQIGIYGGSFDPIHLGHLNLAVEMLERHQLDQIWFCPSAINPFKRQGSQASSRDRLAMLRLAIAGEPRFQICEIELNRPGPSFTVDTLRQLTIAEHTHSTPATFCLLLGQDAARRFGQWHQAEEIIQYARLLIGCRSPGEAVPIFEGSPAVVKALLGGLTPTRIMEISSTEIRQRIANRCFCEHLLPGKVLDYILAHELYFN